MLKLIAVSLCVFSLNVIVAAQISNCDHFVSCSAHPLNPSTNGSNVDFSYILIYSAVGVVAAEDLVHV